MTDLGIFILGAIITSMTLVAVLLVGRAEAQDPALNRESFSGRGGDSA